MKLYAAMMDQLDQNVGIITQKLEDLQIDDNTLVIFCSDNGPWGSKHIRPFDSNGPLRGYKGDIYEGGIRVPMIARWPGQIPAGKVSNAIAYFADIFPTLADLAGVQAPQNIDGISILPTLQGRPQPQLNKRFLYWGNYNNRKRDLQQAARRGNYKAVRMGLQKPMELYDLSVDIGEQNDIASRHPDIVKEFEEYFETDYIESPEWPVPFP